MPTDNAVVGTVPSLATQKSRLMETMNTFFLKTGLWALHLEEAVGIPHCIVPGHKVFGQVQHMDYGIKSVRGVVTLVRLNFSMIQMPREGERFTCHSDLWPKPSLRPVGVSIEEADWSFMYEKIFRPVLEGWARAELQLAGAILKRTLPPESSSPESRPEGLNFCFRRGNSF